MKFLILLFVAAVAFAAEKAPEKELAKYLIKTYEELGIVGRPVKNAADPVKIHVSLILQNIIKMEKNSVTIAAWIQMKWNDPFLTWAPEKFGGITSLALPASAIWRPDIVNYDDIHHKLADQQAGMNVANVVVSSDGSIVWIPRATFQSICSYEYSEEDDDDHLVCPFSIGSWASDAAQIDVFFEKDVSDFSLTSLHPSPIVELVSHSAEKLYTTYDCCPGKKYGVLSYIMTVRKAPKGSYYTSSTCKAGETCSKST